MNFWLCILPLIHICSSIRDPFVLSPLEAKLVTITEEEIGYAKNEVREMFNFGYRNYMTYAYPADELDPIHCCGRGHDHPNPSNININDVLGDYSLTLVDSLDSLVVFGDTEEFKRAVNLVINTVSFEKNTTVQVFEATIRMMGSLLSAHLIASDSSRMLGDFYMEDYDGQLLTLAHDLAARLIVAFDGSATGIPYTRVNLLKGVLPGTVNETCTSGAGTLLLEFGVLSRLLQDPSYENTARRVNNKLWSLRDPNTGLLGNLVNIQTGQWAGNLCGLGAGLDSFYEYMFKAYILFGTTSDLEMFDEAMQSWMLHLRRGRKHCRFGEGEHPLFVNVDSRDGSTMTTWIDSLQASLSGLLVLAGEVDEAICQHAVYYAIWKKYGVLPERYNWKLRKPDVNFYPLRPEFVESTYLLYRATKNSFYLKVGLEIIDSLNEITKVKCGFATVHDVNDGSLEDRMESFFLAETLKYLYLLFDNSNPVNLKEDKLIFSTEGHIFPIDQRFRTIQNHSIQHHHKPVSIPAVAAGNTPQMIEESFVNSSFYRNFNCDNLQTDLPPFLPPLGDEHIMQLFDAIGLDPDF